MMQEVEVLKTIQELICSFFSEEQFTLSKPREIVDFCHTNDTIRSELLWLNSVPKE